MTQEDKKILQRINDYANEVMPDIDPQKTQVSVQLEKLKPIMEQIAGELGISLEDMNLRILWKCMIIINFNFTLKNYERSQDFPATLTFIF